MPGCSALHHTSLHPVDKTAPRSSPTVRSADTCKPSSNPGRSSDTSQPSTHAQKLQPSNNLQTSRRSQQPNRTKSPHFNATAMNTDNSKLPTDLLSVLQVIPVSIMNGKRIVDTYALIDPGSTGTYIVETIAKSIDLKTDRKFNMNVQFLSASKSLPVSRTNFTIAPYADNEKTFSVQNAFCTDHINLPPADTDELNTICQSSPHLRHIKFPDINNGHIEVLLGTACISFTYALEWIRGSANYPSGIRTELGWTIAGEFHVPRRKNSRPINSLIFYATANLSPEQSLFASPDVDFLQHFWNIEKTAVEPQVQQTVNEKEQQALRTLQDTIRHTGERYEIGLPWKPDASLPNNYFAALSQLRSLQKRLKGKPETLQKFNSTIESDLQKNYIAPVIMTHPPPEHIWYLPTHAVENPNKPGKVRRVANAASMFKGTSLNDNLLTGPDLLTDLLKLILRFREHAIGVLADIEGMFMQIAIRPEDQSALRFLWLEDDLVRQYQYTRLIFGANCSPCCAIFTLRKCSFDNSDQFPHVHASVLKDFYMDDFIKSFRTVADARQLTTDLRTVLARGGFRLTKFASNNSSALDHLPETEKETPVETKRVLGQNWSLNDDTYYAPPPKPVTTPSTLRQLFSLVSSIFDPIGLLAPFVIKLKIIIQSLWKRSQSWDQQIPDDIQPIVGKLVAQYRQIPHIAVPRRIFRSTTPVDLHVFTDASISAFAVVIYARQLDTSADTVNLTFVLGKSRVAPIKQQSVPKLELQAAVLGVRLFQTVRKAFATQFQSVTFWTDSCVVLDWIQSRNKLKSFVANRVDEIRQSTSPVDWRYVPTESNPADHGTRGLKPDAIQQKWTRPPPFLAQPPHKWPQRRPLPPANSICAAAKTKLQSVLLNVNRFSSWFRLLRSTAQVFRFVRRLRHRSSDHSLITDDFQRAQHLLFRQSQIESFPSTIAQLHSEESLSSKDKLLPYSPVLDEHAVLRSAGRLQYAPLPSSTRIPIVLDARNRIVQLLLQHYHAVCHHAGPEYVKAFLQQRFLIFSVRCALRTLSHRCFTCRRFRAQNVEPKMAPLPSYRFPSTDQPFPFEKTGVDVFGPFFIVNGRKTDKHYGIIFNCLVTRACHSEPCPSLTTDSFLNAFRRFLARRGQPRLLRSENGTNFIGARRSLQDSLNEGIRYSKDKIPQAADIQWDFNPPLAPHFGGAWERMIQTAKRTLLIILGSQKLTLDFFTTILAETELMLNSRPLTHVADQPENEEPLTPNHFLLHRPYANLPPGVFDSSEQPLSFKSWKEIQKK